MYEKKLKLLMIGMLSLSMVACSSTNKEQAQKEILKKEIPKKEITFATTDSLEETGLVEETLKGFEKENNIDVKVIAKETGEALELGKTKDADILFVHAKPKEEEFIKKGYGCDRKEIMYNYFIVVGPKGKEENEKLKDMSIEELFKHIQENDERFLSRGDKSGTHIEELCIWKKSGVENDFENYNEVDKGMAATLEMASEMGAYTLTDLSTYLTMKDNLDLEIINQPDESLKNIYSIVTVANLQEDKKEIATKLIEYYKSEKVQNKIKEYGMDKYKEPLFYTFG